MKTILNIIYYRPKQWCNGHKGTLLIAIVIEMVLLVPLLAVHHHRHDTAGVYTDLGMEALCAVLLTIMLFKITR